MYDQDLLRLIHTRYYLSCTCCIFLCITLSDKCLKSWVCMCLYSLSARFTQDGCDQRLQWHPLSAVWAPTKHSCGGCHWTDVCRPAQLLVAGACHSAHLRFIWTSVTPWKNNMSRLTGLAQCTQSLCSVMGLKLCRMSPFLSYLLHVLLSDKSFETNGVTSTMYLL